MLFNLEEDSGARVRGYVVPDGYAGVPAIRVCAGGEELFTFHANELREALVGAGRHATGQCGFSIDTGVLPNLHEVSDLELSDAETGVLIYRRPGQGNIQKKILRLETHLFPLWSIDKAVAPHFQYFAKGIESLGRETITQLFLLNGVESIYLSGNILYRNYAYFIEPAFQTVIVLQDPYEELAERLLVLSVIRRAGSEHLGIRESAALEPAIEFAESLPFRDEKALRRALRQMPQSVAALLANPLARQLTTNTPDEMPSGSAVAAALDILANATLIARRHDCRHFREGLAEFLGLAVEALPALPQFATVPPLAQMLRRSGEVDVVLEKDLELYHHIETAFNKSP